VNNYNGEPDFPLWGLLLIVVCIVAVAILWNQLVWGDPQCLVRHCVIAK
jgi:hypothetical protein